ncbi:MAG: SAM-dependent methyltransferase [Acidimicrobiales bacterium]
MKVDVPGRGARRQRPQSYAERTYASPYWIVRYPHRRRFELAASMVLEARPSTILDYGTGDGELLIGLLRHPDCPPSLRAIAYEPVTEMRGVLRSRLAEEGLSDRIEVAASLEEIPDASCDVMTCMNVLEHMTLPNRYIFFEFSCRALRPDGRVVLDVPVEFGPAILVKNLGRRILKADGKEYTVGESVAASLGRTNFDPHRYDPQAGKDYIFTHKGFDHRLFVRELAGWYEVDRIVRSPVTWLPALANQEVIILAHPRGHRGEGDQHG